MLFLEFSELNRGAVDAILGSKLRKPLTKVELRELIGLPFEAVIEVLKNEGDPSIKTPLGTFKKTARQAYRFFSPKKGGYAEVPAVVKIRFQPNLKFRTAIRGDGSKKAAALDLI